MPTNYLLRQWQNSGGLNAQDPQSFASDLQTTLVPRSSAGSSTPTFTRATTAYQTDFEGKLNAVLSGEARFQGARRVANSLGASKSEDLTSWNTTTGTTAVGAFTENNGSSFHFINTSVGSIINGHTYWFSAEVKQSIGSRNIYVGNNGVGFSIFNPSTGVFVADVGTVLAHATNSVPTIDGYIRIYAKVTAGAADQFNIGLANGSTTNYAGDGVSTVLVRKIYAVDITGVTNTNPPEYVSVGVLSDPYQGAGVDGVQYFQTLNGNTVASNVVTEATGAQIKTGTAGVSATAPVDAGGPFSSREDNAGTQILATADIRDMTTANWTLGATMTRARTSVGADGSANSATRLTAGAVAATNIITTLITAAATSRTYSALVKRVTGTGPVRISQDAFATNTDISGQLISGVYVLVQLTQSQLNAVMGLKVDTNLDAIDVDFNQFEAGGFATSRMAATGAARNADVEQYVSAGNLPTNDFTVYGEVVWETIPTAASYFLWASYVDASNYTAVLWDGTNLIARKRIGGANHDATKALTPVAGTRYKWAGRFTSTTGTDIFHSGAIGTNDATNTACQIGAAFQIGADGNGANQPYADNSNSRIYPKALPTSKLIALTT